MQHFVDCLFGALNLKFEADSGTNAVHLLFPETPFLHVIKHTDITSMVLSYVPVRPKSSRFSL